MDSKSIKLLLLFFTAIVLVVIAFPMNEWLAKTMLRHQLIEIPLIFFCGIFTGRYIWKLSAKDSYIAVSMIIFIMFSLIFWMLPKSVDLAALSPSFNKIMNIHIFIVGWLTTSVLKDTIFELKIFLLGMIAAKLMAVGVTLRVFNLLLCSAFSIEQQEETGFYMILLAIVLFIYTTYVLIQGISRTAAQ